MHSSARAKRAKPMSDEERVLMIETHWKETTIRHNKTSACWGEAENAFNKFEEGDQPQKLAMEKAASRTKICLAEQMWALKETAILVLANTPDAPDVYHQEAGKAAEEIEPLLKCGLGELSENACIRKVTDFPKPLNAGGAGQIVIRLRVEVSGPISTSEYYPDTEQQFDKFMLGVLREMLAPLWDFLLVTETITTAAWDE